MKSKQLVLLFTIVLFVFLCNCRTASAHDIEVCLLSEEVYKNNATDFVQFSLVKLVRNIRAWAAIYEQRNTSRVVIVFRGKLFVLLVFFHTQNNNMFLFVRNQGNW